MHCCCHALPLLCSSHHVQHTLMSTEYFICFTYVLYAQILMEWLFGNAGIFSHSWYQRRSSGISEVPRCLYHVSYCTGFPVVAALGFGVQIMTPCKWSPLLAVSFCFAHYWQCCCHGIRWPPLQSLFTVILKEQATAKPAILAVGQ